MIKTTFEKCTKIEICRRQNDIMKKLLSVVLIFGFLYASADTMFVLAKARSDAEENKETFFDSSQWFVDIVPCGFLCSEDSKMAFVVAADNIYSDGARWSPKKINSNGEINDVEISRKYNRYCKGNDLWARRESFWRLDYNDGKPPVLYVSNIGFQWQDSKQKTWSVRVDSLVSANSMGELECTPVRCGEVSRMIREHDFARFRHICPTRYEGFGLVRKASTDNELKSHKVISGEAQKKFVQELCNALPQSSIYVVRLDADGDGNEDMYVTTDESKVNESEYRWELYIYQAGRMIKAKERIVMNESKHAYIQVLDPEEVASKDSFYKLLHSFGDSSGCESVAIFDLDDKCGVSHTCKKLLPEKDRIARCKIIACEGEKRGREFETWYFEVKDRLGYAPPQFLCDMLSDHSLVCIERIKCEEFKPGSTQE